MLTRLRFQSTCRRLLLFVLLASGLFSSQVYAETAKLIMKATYEGKISGLNVELKRTLIQYPDGRYLLRSYASKVFASIEETSLFTLHEGEVRPQQYRYERSIFGRKAIEKIVYDWEQLTARYTRSDRPQNNTQHTLTAGLLDPALYQLAIQADLAKNHKGLHYRFIKRKDIEQYSLLARTSEKATVDGKTYDATVVLREDPDSSKTTKVWVVPALDSMIAKIRHVDKDGDEFEINLTEYAVAEDMLNTFYRAFSNNDKPGKADNPQPSQ